MYNYYNIKIFSILYEYNMTKGTYYNVIINILFYCEITPQIQYNSISNDLAFWSNNSEH